MVFLFVMDLDPVHLCPQLQETSEESAAPDESTDDALEQLDTYRQKFLWSPKRRVEWYMDLFLLADKLQATHLRRYVEDALVGHLSDHNWADLWVFADEKEALALRDAALQFGLRQIAPFAFLRFFGKNMQRNSMFVEDAASGRKRSTTSAGKEDGSTTASDGASSSSKSPSGASSPKTANSPLKGSGSSASYSPGSGRKGDAAAATATRGAVAAADERTLFFSHQSPWFKSNALEKFLFDLDLPHTPGLVLQEHFYGGTSW